MRIPLISHPAQGALTWRGIEIMVNGLGHVNGEILGRLWALLVSLTVLRTGGPPKGLSILGLWVGLGVVGILSLLSGLTAVLTGVFVLSQVIRFA